ncbi:MAG TPA: VTT domain-containing protein [Nevskiaceae bacterium]|nr:VTT domain-containing protein [Nevskiaceae bacterium]
MVGKAYSTLKLKKSFYGMKDRLVKLFQNEKFKKIALVLGVLFIVLTLVISFNPKPFLKFGYLGVFVFNLFGPGTLLIPALSRYMNIFGLAFVTSLGMALNDSVSWLIGRSGDVVIPRSKKVLKMEDVLQKYGPFALFVLSFMPLPYDFIGLIAGYLGISFKFFLMPTFLGRFIRMILIGMGTVAMFDRASL